jgi:membrane-bound lytic murein transglycosylase A
MLQHVSLSLLLVFLLGACATVPQRLPPAKPVASKPTPPKPTPAKPTPPVTQAGPQASATGVASALTAPLRQLESSQVGWDARQLAAALPALQRSCPALLKRTDQSGLTLTTDWQAFCDAVRSSGMAPENRAPEKLLALLPTLLTPVRVATGAGLNTGYYEPLLQGARTPSARFSIPLYKRPPDLIDVDLGAFRPESLRGQRLAGRILNNRLVPYDDRQAIDQGALAGKGLGLLWVSDPYEAFFLHIQGSGQVELPDGTRVRVGFDGQNGHVYTGIGRVLRARNALAPGEATMQGIIRYLSADPARGQALMWENRSYVFFREIKGDGPIGALGVALTPRRSIAVDPLFVPLGAPVWLEGAQPDPQDPKKNLVFAQLMVAQDTGGAIRGANRVDVFWGDGADAALVAGAMSVQNTLILLLPNASVARLKAQGLLQTDVEEPFESAAQ